MTKSLLFQNLIYKKLLKLITDLINKLYKFFFIVFILYEGIIIKQRWYSVYLRKRYNYSHILLYI